MRFSIDLQPVINFWFGESSAKRDESHFGLALSKVFVLVVRGMKPKGK